MSKCPSCGNPWPPVKPFKQLHCKVCKAEKSRRMDLAGQKELNLATVRYLGHLLQRQEETKETLKARAEKDRKELWR